MTGCCSRFVIIDHNAALQMQYRYLSGTELRSSVIGFGCASVLGTVGASRSRLAMKTALDAGINYFDLARSYGFGAAESFVGRFIGRQRDQVILTSKFGIMPPKQNTLLNRLRPLVRPAYKLLGQVSPGAQESLRKRAGGMAWRDQFNVASARKSLEQSLRDLRTDYLDIWLLHDCVEAVACDDELFTFLDSTVAAGKVRYYGVASNPGAVAAVLSGRPAARVAQFASSVADNAVGRFQSLTCSAEPAAAAIVTHSPFGRRSLWHNLAAFLAKEPESTRRWSMLLNLDLQAPAGIGEFLLRYAIISNLEGIVICGMYDPAHIRANAAAADRIPTAGPIEQVVAEMRDHHAFDCKDASIRRESP